MTADPDPYEFLGVSPKANDVVIRAAFAARMRQLLPEDGRSRGPAADAEMQALTAAYAVLSDPKNRAAYDAMRAAGRMPTPEPEPTTRSDLAAASSAQPQLVSEVASAGGSKAPRIGAGVSPWAWLGASLGVIALVLVALGASHAGLASMIPASSTTTDRAPTGTSGDQVAPSTFVSWSADAAGDPHTYQVNDLTITLSSQSGTSGGNPSAVIAVKDQKGGAFTMVGQSGGQVAAARIGVGKIDAHGDGDQVLFLTYSGGAHCCTEVTLIERTRGGWRKKDLGTWDGKPLSAFPTDVDGDGVVDLVFSDQRFAYRFTDYADSFMPPRIFNVVGGKTAEVSNDARFAHFYETDFDKAKTGCLAHNNGACAAYVAIGARLGRRDEAWADLLQAYDQSSTWTLPSACSGPLQKNTCPLSEVIAFKTFPAALAWFLVDAGYPSWTAGQAASPQRAPSYDCSRVTSANLDLICATPQLSAADRDLAVAYTQALSRAPDPQLLQSEQRTWTGQRNNSAPDIDLLVQLYAARISALKESPIF